MSQCLQDCHPGPNLVMQMNSSTGWHNLQTRQRRTICTLSVRLHYLRLMHLLKCPSCDCCPLSFGDKRRWPPSTPRSPESCLTLISSSWRSSTWRKQDFPRTEKKVVNNVVFFCHTVPIMDLASRIFNRCVNMPCNKYPVWPSHDHFICCGHTPPTHFTQQWITSDCQDESACF